MDVAADAAAAFPTALLVSAMRAFDAAGGCLIGSSIGAGPDLFAAKLAGKEGMEMLETGTPLSNMSVMTFSSCVISRSLLLDKYWMAARSSGVTQVGRRVAQYTYHLQTSPRLLRSSLS